MSKQRPINIKVSTSKVIDALKASHELRTKQVADYEKAKKQYDKEVKEFRESLSDLFRSGKGKSLSVSKVGSYRYNEEENNKWEITVEFPASVKAPAEPKQPYTAWQIEEEIKELENAIKLLSMSDEEFVSTNTYSGVARYI